MRRPETAVRGATLCQRMYTLGNCKYMWVSDGVLGGMRALGSLWRGGLNGEPNSLLINSNRGESCSMDSVGCLGRDAWMPARPAVDSIHACRSEGCGTSPSGSRARSDGLTVRVRRDLAGEQLHHLGPVGGHEVLTGGLQGSCLITQRLYRDAKPPRDACQLVAPAAATRAAVGVPLPGRGPRPLWRGR